MLRSRLFTLVLRIAFPATLMHLAQPLMGVVDTFLMGRAGVFELAALSLGSAFLALILNPFNCLRMSLVGLCAQHKAARRTDEMFLVFFQGLGTALVLGLALIPVLSFLLQGYADWMDLEEGLKKGFLAYGQVRVLGLPLGFIDLVVTGFLMGRGQVGLALKMAAFVNLANALISIYLVEFLHLGIAGVALGTVSAQFLLCGWQLAAVFSQPDFRFRFQLQGFSKLFSLQKDIFLRSLALALVLQSLPTLARPLGILAVAINAVFLQLLTLMAYGQDGLAAAAEVLAGRAWGKGQSDYLKRLIRLIFRVGMGIALILGAPGFFWFAGFLEFLSSDPALKTEALRYRILVLLIPFLSTPAWLLDGIYTGLSRSRVMRNSMVMLAFGFFLVVFPLREAMDLWGIWVALMIFMAFRGIWLGTDLTKAIFRS